MRGDESTRFVDMEPTLHRLDAKRIVNDVAWAQGQENPEPITSIDDRAFKCKTKGADRTRLEESRMENVREPTQFDWRMCSPSTIWESLS